MEQPYWHEMRERLKQFLRQRIPHPQDAEDILQDILTTAYAKKVQLRDEELLTAWIYRIARNALTDYYRRRGKQPVHALAPEHMPDEVASDGYTDRTREFSSCILPMIEALPQPYREALLLTEIGGLSQKELAQRMGISYSGAKSRVQRGREKLRDMLLACCYIETDQYGNIVDYNRRRKS